MTIFTFPNRTQVVHFFWFLLRAWHRGVPIICNVKIKVYIFVFFSHLAIVHESDKIYQMCLYEAASELSFNLISIYLFEFCDLTKHW